ncbi:choline transporter protein 2-like [Tropilaelaps mercedesae]|uniref:Choline transporter-like protein n=1 Tax=Tropilaelaps mercedesae TaxID=418985 RepID=A0A1V9XCI7_9ACAR|nr:choline transporter protein 2-like [Tropilaelaps mercedesae]
MRTIEDVTATNIEIVAYEETAIKNVNLRNLLPSQTHGGELCGIDENVNMGCTDSPYIGIALDVVWDIADTHLTILGGFGVALVIGVLWMLLIRFLAGVVVWVSLMSFLMLFSALTVFTGVRAYEAYKQDPNSRVDASKLRNSPYVGSRWPIWAGMSGVLGLLFLFTLLILLFLRKRIQIAIALIKQASRSIANLPTLLVFPLFLYVLQVAALAFVAAFTLYHLGTLAFGSLILTICGLIKKSIKYVQRKPNSTTSNSCMQGILKSCACCFWLLEKLLKYVNKNAYIMVAMYGKNFCRSAGKAFKLIVNNAFRALVLTKVTDFFIFIAKLVTVATTSTLAYFALDSDSTREFLKIENRPKYIQAPVATIAIGSYILTSCFFNVYSNAVDTLFLCFLEDQKLNDGSRERPYQMPSELFKILNKGNYKRKYRTN